MRNRFLISCLSILFLASCSKTRIKEHQEWGTYFQKYGITNGCFMLRDNNHEAIHYYNKDRCLERILPASTFKVFLSLVALETDVAPDDQFYIPWDSVHRRPEWDKGMTMREALKTSNEGYFQHLAKMIGGKQLQHYLDTVKYGNMKIGNNVASCWEDNSLQISADEQTGFIKRLYFNELPFSERSQRIVRSLMLQETTPSYRLSYKTGWGEVNGKNILWVVGFAEHIENVDEPKESMNKSSVREYPYFFAENFEVPGNDTTKDWAAIRLDIARNVLQSFGALSAKSK